MSGSVTGITLSNSSIADSSPVGTQVGTISVTLSDGTPFNGTIALSGPFASMFNVVRTRDPYSITAINLSNLIVPASVPSGTLVGNISVTLSDGEAFTGSLSVNDTAHFAISGGALVTAAVLAGGNYPITVTATDNSSTNRTLSTNFQIVAQAAVQLPGPLVNLASSAKTTTSITVGWSAPTTGGVLDNGIHQIQYKANASSTWINLPQVLYCTPTHGSIVDAFGNTWLINPTGSPNQGQPNAVMCNGVFANGFNSPLLYLVGSSIYHVNTAGTWYSFTPSGAVNGTNVSWAQTGTTAPITTPGETVSGLTTNATYNFRGYATNSAGQGPTTTPINVTTSSVPVNQPVQTPDAAIAAGYTTLAFFSGFDSPSELTNDRSGGTTTKWYTIGDGLSWTIANSVLSLHNSIVGDNEDIKTITGGGATRVSRPGAIVQGDGNGVRFQYGYFEAMLKLDINNISGNGWIAWWCHGFQGNEGNVPNHGSSIEFDFLEVFQPGGLGATSVGLWNWDPSSGAPTFATPGWNEGDTTFHPTSQSTANAAAGNFADWVIVGALATPSRCAVYWNSKARRASGIADTLVLDVDTTRPYNTSAGSQVFDAVRNCDWPLLLGGSSGSDFQIDYVAVWQ